MSSVKFKDHLAVKGGQDVTIEGVFRAMSAYAGIHSFQFDDEFADEFTATTQWDVAGAEGTWQIVSNQMQGSGTSGWQFCVTNTYETPKAFVLDIDSPSGSYGAVGVLATDKDNLIFCWWTATAVGITQRSGDSDTTLCNLAKSEGSPQQIRVSVQPAISGGDCFISWWSNEEFMANAHLNTYPTGRKLALGCYAANTVTFDNAHIPELTEALDVVTLDVGETPGGALQRAIGRRHINYYVRFNGSLRAWRPKAVASSLTLTTGDIAHHEEAHDRRGLVSHWRQVGAWDKADAFDATLLDQIGHRFHKDDNPDLLTVDDCETEAALSLTRAQEYAHTLGIRAPFCVFLEPEDRLTIDSEEWLLTGYGVQLQAGSLELDADLREYTYE